MSFGDKVKEKSRDFADKISQQYREHLGEELIKKEQKLNELEKELNKREQEISEREKVLKRHYLIPRRFIQIPAVILLVAVASFIYLSPSSVNVDDNSNSLQSKPVQNHYQRSDEPHKQSYNECFDKGILYYQEIGSYPYLSSGESAEKKVRENCRRSNMAF